MNLALGLAGALCLAVVQVRAADWPLWRFDAHHSANSPERLATNLTLHWTREYPARVPAWEDPLNQDLMGFDAIFEPVVLDGRLFIGFNDRDKVVALDAQTGKELWTFYADGPVRMAPAAARGKVYFTSDDGHLYCVRAADGQLLWRFAGGPSERKALGNSRLVSAWPARGGPVIRDGTVYFAASIWPFMGTFIYALEAETGKVKWVNDGNGAHFMKQPHSAPAFGSVAPQGPLVATDKILLVPGGRSVPAAFDRQTGDFMYYHLTESGKGTGGSLVLASTNEFYVHTRQRGTRAHELSNGKRTTFIVNEPVVGGGHLYAASVYPSNYLDLVELEQKLETAVYNETKARHDFADALEAGDRNSIRMNSNTLANAVRRLSKYTTATAQARSNLPAGPLPKVVQAWRSGDKSLQWEAPVDASGDLIRAGGRFYAAGSTTLTAFDAPRARQPARVVWQQPVQGEVRRLLAASGRLFAVTREGRILAYGPGAARALAQCSKINHNPSRLHPPPLSARRPSWRRPA